MNSLGFNFAIKTSKTLGNADLYTEGVTNNVIDFGTVEFIVPSTAPAQLYYIATNDPDMYGNIYILESSTTTTTIP